MRLDCPLCQYNTDKSDRSDWDDFQRLSFHLVAKHEWFNKATNERAIICMACHERFEVKKWHLANHLRQLDNLDEHFAMLRLARLHPTGG